MRVALLALALMVSAPVAAQEVASRAGLEGFVTLDRLPIPDQPLLAEGRVIWGETCENGHGGNKPTGAPKITSTEAWEPRIAQGFDVLLPHAIKGFLGPRYPQMPARGGNPDLSDAEVTLAVAFMVWASGGEAEAARFLEDFRKGVTQ